MGVKTYSPDDPEFAAYIAGSQARAVIPEDRPPAPYHPTFGDYVNGKTGHAPSAEERYAMTTKIAKEDEVMTLPDGRQIQIQAKGAPVVEELAERERDLVQASIDNHTADPTDHLVEIQAE